MNQELERLRNKYAYEAEYMTDEENQRLEELEILAYQNTCDDEEAIRQAGRGR